MNISHYWLVSAELQTVIRKAVEPPPALYRGKYPHVYGCKGQEADSAKCWRRQHGYGPGDCSCPCHTDCGGEW